MKLIDINPFVRYAMHNRLLSSEYASKSLDNRIFYIEEDGGDVIINGKKYPVRTNMLILFQCGTEYLFTNKNVIPAISINFDYTQDKCHITTPYKIVNAYNNQEQFSKIHPIEFEDCPPLNSPIIIQDAKWFSDELEKIISEKAMLRPYSNSIISATLKGLIIKILRLQSIASVAGEVNFKIEKILKYIENNYHTDINNSFLADIAGYHPYHLNKLMVAATGVTLHQYIINCRLSAAEKLLINSDATLKEIAEAVGFSDTMLLITNFKKKKNITPTDFRKKMRNI